MWKVICFAVALSALFIVIQAQGKYFSKTGDFNLGLSFYLCMIKDKNQELKRSSNIIFKLNDSQVKYT